LVEQLGRAESVEIVKVEHIGKTQLHLTFSDGTQGDYDFAPLLAKDASTNPG
jgi:DUF971 family protein